MVLSKIVKCAVLVLVEMARAKFEETLTIYKYPENLSLLEFEYTMD